MDLRADEPVELDSAGGDWIRLPEPIHALRVGTWAASTGTVAITPEIVADLADSYDPSAYQAPVVLGHPEDDHPAWGEVLAAHARPDGLWLDVRIDRALAEQVAAGRYRAVSISYWPRGAVGSPRPDRHYLRHLGVLGAQAPAVKGLRPLREAVAAALAAAPDYVEIVVPSEVVMSERSDQGQGQADPPEREVVPIVALQLAEREARVAALERAIAEREAELLRRERELRRAQLEAKFQAHAQAGRVLAAEVPTLVALAERLAEGGTVSLADGGERPAVELLEEFVARLPPRVQLGETIRGRPVTDDPDAIARQITEIRAREASRGVQISYTEALRRVRGGE